MAEVESNPEGGGSGGGGGSGLGFLNFSLRRVCLSQAFNRGHSMTPMSSNAED